MCERCKQGDVNVGDVMWRAIVDTDWNDDTKATVIVESAVIATNPDKNLRVKLKDDKDCDYRVFLGLRAMVPLRALQHSREAALRELFETQKSNLATARERYRVCREAWIRGR